MARAEEVVFNEQEVQEGRVKVSERGQEKAGSTVARLGPWSLESDAEWSAISSVTGRFAQPASSSVSSMLNGNNTINCMIGCL